MILKRLNFADVWLKTNLFACEKAFRICLILLSLSFNAIVLVWVLLTNVVWFWCRVGYDWQHPFLHKFVHVLNLLACLQNIRWASCKVYGHKSICTNALVLRSLFVNILICLMTCSQKHLSSDFRLGSRQNHLCSCCWNKLQIAWCWKTRVCRPFAIVSACAANDTNYFKTCTRLVVWVATTQMPFIISWFCNDNFPCPLHASKCRHRRQMWWETCQFLDNLKSWNWTTGKKRMAGPLSAILFAQFGIYFVFVNVLSESSMKAFIWICCQL